MAAKGSYDVVVVGGGIYGVSVALECVARGLEPILVERADFGQETSANSLRIVHGGLRYLQRLDLPRFRRSVEQRRWWLRTFPGLVRPLPCLMPLYGAGLHRPSVLRVGLGLNDLLSPLRNHGVRGDRRIPRGRILGPDTTVDRFPACRPEGLRGAALWSDAVMESPHRLIMEMLRWISEAGGIALNYVAARGLRVREGRVRGLLAVDRLTGDDIELNAPLVVNAAGPWSATLAESFGTEQPELFRPSLAFNVLLRRGLQADVAVAVSAPDPGAPVRFLHPSGGLTLAGTVHAALEEDPSSDGSAGKGEGPAAAHLPAFLAELNRAIPGLDASADDVVRVFWGRLPASAEGVATLRTHPIVVDHGRGGGPHGLFSVSGVKFTTAPAVARTVLDRALGQKARPDWARIAKLRPNVRAWPTAPSGNAREAELERVLRDALPALRKLVKEEAVHFAEDLVHRRIDWNLADLDLDVVNREVARLLPDLPPRSLVGPPDGPSLTPPGSSSSARQIGPDR